MPSEAEKIQRLIDLAVLERTIGPAEGKKLAAFIARKQGDLEQAVGYLMRFHNVSPERAQGLLARALDPRTVVPGTASAPASKTPTVKLVTPPAGHAVLVVKPSNPSEARVAVYAAALEVPLDQARVALSDPLPRIARQAHEAEILALAERLQGVGIPVLVLEAGAVLDPLSPQKVTAEEARRLDLSRRALLVLGPGFAHLYFDDDDRPLELDGDTSWVPASVTRNDLLRRHSAPNAGVLSRVLFYAWASAT